jgi:hypothetical protein
MFYYKIIIFNYKFLYYILESRNYKDVTPTIQSTISEIKLQSSQQLHKLFYAIEFERS